jgi:hypothetical protein
VLTPSKCRLHSAECRRLAEQTSNARVKDILLDMARTWTRLALEAEQWNQENSPHTTPCEKHLLQRSGQDHLPQSSSASRFTAGAFGFLNLSQSGDRPDR